MCIGFSSALSSSLQAAHMSFMLQHQYKLCWPKGGIQSITSIHKYSVVLPQGNKLVN